jgi:hypothetical protein
MVTAMVVVPPRAGFAGMMLQVALAGAPRQVKAALPGVPGVEVRRKGKVAEAPLAMLTVVGPLAVRVKSTPVPVRVRDWGELAAESAKARAPVRGPPRVGAKAIWRVQAVAGARVEGQVLLAARMEKSPVTAAPWMDRGTPPLLVRVTVTGWEVTPTAVMGKAIVAKGERETPAGARPLPLRATVWERNWSATVRVPVFAPTDLGT